MIQSLFSSKKNKEQLIETKPVCLWTEKNIILGEIDEYWQKVLSSFFQEPCRFAQHSEFSLACVDKKECAAVYAWNSSLQSDIINQLCDNNIPYLEIDESILREKDLLAPFDMIGEDWQSNSEKPICILWGIPAEHRQKITTYYPDYRVAFARPKTNWKIIQQALNMQNEIRIDIKEIDSNKFEKLSNYISERNIRNVNNIISTHYDTNHYIFFTIPYLRLRHIELESVEVSKRNKDSIDKLFLIFPLFLKFLFQTEQSAWHEKQSEKILIIGSSSWSNDYKRISAVRKNYPSHQIGYLPEGQVDSGSLQLFKTAWQDIEIFSKKNNNINLLLQSDYVDTISENYAFIALLAGKKNINTLTLDKHSVQFFMESLGSALMDTYYINTEIYAGEVTFEELMALSLLTHDEIIKCILLNVKSIVPDTIPSESLALQKMNKPEFHSLNQWANEVLSKSILGLFLLDLASNDSDPSDNFIQLYYLANSNKPSIFSFCSIIYTLITKFRYIHAENILNKYILYMKSRKAIASFTEYSNFFKNYFFARLYIHYSPYIPLHDLIDFTRFPNMKERSALIKQSSRSLLRIRGEHIHVEELINKYILSPEDKQEILVSNIASINAMQTENISWFQYSMQKKYAYEYVKNIPFPKIQTSHPIVYKVNIAYNMRDRDLVEQYISDFVNTAQALTKSTFTSSDISILNTATNYLFQNSKFELGYSILNKIKPFLSKYAYVCSLGEAVVNFPLSTVIHTSQIDFQLKRKQFIDMAQSIIGSSLRLNKLLSSIHVQLGEYSKAASFFHIKYIAKCDPSNFWQMHMQKQHILFCETACMLANSTAQPKVVKGVVFLCTAPPRIFSGAGIMAPAIAELKKQGFAVLNLSQSAYHDEKTHIPLIDQFSGIIPQNAHDGHLSKTWNIDWENRILACDGHNYFQGMLDHLSIRLRKSRFKSVNEPDLREYVLDTELYRFDYALRICEKIYKDLTCNGMPVIFLTHVPHSSPQVIYRDFAYQKNHKCLRMVNIGCTYDYYSNLTSGNKAYLSHTINAVDLTVHRGCRGVGSPPSPWFAKWYEENMNEPAIDAFIDKIQANNYVDKDSNKSSSYLDAITKAKKEGKKIICCLSRLTFDLGLPYDGGPAHIDMHDWLNHSIEILAENNDFLLLIKPHPSEVRSEISYNPPEKIRDWLPEELPSNVIFLPHREFNSAELNSFVDLAIIWTGTASMEMTVAGIPVMACSYFGVSDYPDVVGPKDRKQYEEYILQGNYAFPTAEKKHKSGAFLYYLTLVGGLGLPYPYAHLQITNYPQIEPTLNSEAINKYLNSGDKILGELVRRITEGVEGTPSIFLTSWYEHIVRTNISEQEEREATEKEV